MEQFRPKEMFARFGAIRIPVLLRLLPVLVPVLGLLLAGFCVSGVATAVTATHPEIVELWPGNAPGETVKSADVDSAPGAATQVTNPRLLIFRPDKKTTDAAVLVIPGGGYSTCFYGIEGIPIAEWWNRRGVTAAVLIYRVPRPTEGEIHRRAWPDAQRAVKILRSKVDELGIDSEKIGVQGFSAGGNLSILTACASQTRAYDPIDALDDLPCHVNFAIPVYPAYVLDDGVGVANAQDGEGAALVLDTLKFDDKTPPICLIHGDADPYSPLGSVEIYRLLHRRKIPVELHIYQGAPHGFMSWDKRANTRPWLETAGNWLESLGFLTPTTEVPGDAAEPPSNAPGVANAPENDADNLDDVLGFKLIPIEASATIKRENAAVSRPGGPPSVAINIDGLANTGHAAVIVEATPFEPLTVKKGGPFSLTFFAKATSIKSMKIVVPKLEGGTLAEAKVTGLAADWKEFTVTLTPSESYDKGRICFQFSQQGTVCLTCPRISNP